MWVVVDDDDAGRDVSEVPNQPRRQLARRLDAGQSRAHDEGSGCSRGMGAAGQGGQVPLQRHRTVVGVDVESELTETRDVGLDHLAAQRNDETVVGGCAKRRGHCARRRVDGRHVRGGVSDSSRLEHIPQRNAALGQVGLVVADPNVVIGLRADHSDLHVAVCDAEFVESPGRTERCPKTRETRAEHHDLAHPADATRTAHSLPVNTFSAGCG